MNIFDTANSISIREVYSRYVNGVSGMGKGNVRCPFHGPDNKPSFGFIPNKNKAHCFTCNKTWSPIDFVKEIKKYEQPFDAAKELCETFGLEYDYEAPSYSESYKNYCNVYAYVTKLYSLWLNDLMTPDYTYFSDRKISDEVIKKYQLGYCPVRIIGSSGDLINLRSVLIHKFSNLSTTFLDSLGIYDSDGNSVMADRFIIPIRDSNGYVVAFGGRSLDPSLPKYLNTRDTLYFKKNNILFNYFSAKHYGYVYVVEGYMDALSLISCGINNVVASMGTALTADHLSMLSGKEIILSLDNDDPGKKSMFNLIKAYPAITFKVLTLSKVKDFNEALASGLDVKSIVNLQNTVYGIEYALHYLKDTLDLNFVYNREYLYRTVSFLLPNYSEVVQDYIKVSMNRLLYGKRA